jgi:hypothetical protein
LCYTLYWQALVAMSTRYKIVAHLVGQDGPTDIWSQADSFPHLPTTSWMVGEMVSDRLDLDLPRGLPAGHYRLLLGWYDEQCGQRLGAFGPDGEELGNALELEEIVVKE